jgi:3-hydroxyisobutyrate dehydrogenase-like beta-hydroxyacid dehydrogenase
MSDISVIGLGTMGSALAAAFLNRNIATYVWNRSSAKTDALVAKGAVRTATVRDALAASKLVVVCLLNYDTVYEALKDARDALSGRVLINLTNGTPAQARDMARWAADFGANYLDGGIMAVPPMIGRHEALILYSGSKDAFEDHKRQLEILGTAKYLGNDAGLASLYDLALLAGMWGMFAGAIHAVALVDTEKVTARQFMSLLMPWLNAMSPGLVRLAEQVDAGDYTEGVVSNLAMQAVAYSNLVEASEAQGVSTKLIAPMHDLMNSAVATGYGAAGLSSLIELIRKPRPSPGECD